MKLKRCFSVPLLTVALAAATPALAQTPVQTAPAIMPTDLNSMGTITEFSPEMITVRSESASAPIRYTSSKTITYVDDAGAPVSIETVKSGLPVTVYYSQVDGQMVASRVVVSRTTATTNTIAPAAAPVIEEKKTTTTTTTEGQ